MAAPGPNRLPVEFAALGFGLSQRQTSAIGKTHSCSKRFVEKGTFCNTFDGTKANDTNVCVVFYSVAKKEEEIKKRLEIY